MKSTKIEHTFEKGLTQTYVRSIIETVQTAIVIKTQKLQPVKDHRCWRTSSKQTAIFTHFYINPAVRLELKKT